MMKEEFFIVSSELREPYEPRACRIIKRVRSNIRDDMALVSVEPPIPRKIRKTQVEIQVVPRPLHIVNDQTHLLREKGFSDQARAINDKAWSEFIK